MRRPSTFSGTVTTERMPVPLEERDGAGDGRQVLVDGGHPGRAVAAGARLDGDAGEALAGGGQAGGGAYLQLRLVVGGEEQEGGVGVEHVAGAFHRALEQAVEVVRGRGADEDLERVGGLALGAWRRVGGGPRNGVCRTARSWSRTRRQTVEGSPLGVADPQVGGVHRGDAAVGAADAVTALPAGELEGLDDAGAGAGGVRPGGEVGERLADDLLGRVAEEFLGVLVPGGDGAGAVDLDDRDADPAVGQREEVGGEGRAGGAGADRALGEVELEPDLLVGGRVLDAPAAGEGRAELEAAAALAVGAAHVDGRALEGDLALRVAVGHLDAYAVVAAQTQDVGGGARVDDGVGDQFAGEDDGVVDDVGEAPALEGVADEGAGGRDRSSDGLEAGGRARGDHRTPRPVVDMRGSVADPLLPWAEAVPCRPGILGCPPGCSPVVMVRCPSDACPLVLVPPPRPDGPARLDSRMQGYLPSRSMRMPVCSVSVPRGCADGVRSCRTVMAGFSRGETLGRLRMKVGQPG